MDFEVRNSNFKLLIARSYPPDVLVLDSNSLIHARVVKGKGAFSIQTAKSYRIPEGTIEPSVVTPQIVNEAALAEVLRRLKLETGRWDKASLLLPDSWFRINILELQALPDNPNEAQEILRWSLKRTMPIDAASLRLAYAVISRGAQVKVPRGSRTTIRGRASRSWPSAGCSSRSWRSTTSIPGTATSTTPRPRATRSPRWSARRTWRERSCRPRSSACAR